MKRMEEKRTTKDVNKDSTDATPLFIHPQNICDNIQNCIISVHISVHKCVANSSSLNNFKEVHFANLFPFSKFDNNKHNSPIGGVILARLPVLSTPRTVDVLLKDKK